MKLCFLFLSKLYCRQLRQKPTKSSSLNLLNTTIGESKSFAKLLQRKLVNTHYRTFFINWRKMQWVHLNNIIFWMSWQNISKNTTQISIRATKMIGKNVRKICFTLNRQEVSLVVKKASNLKLKAIRITSLRNSKP